MDKLQHIETVSLLETPLPLRPVRKVSVEYQELVDSVRDRGVLQPLLVRPVGDRFEVVEGSYRRAAALECRLETVPCIVREMTDAEVLAVQLEANAIRPTTQKAEFADRIYRIMEEKNLNVPQLAAMLHKSPQWLRETLLLRGLSNEVKAKVNRGEISIQAAVALAKLPSKLQGEYSDLVGIMSTAEFVESCRLALKNFREMIKSGRLDNTLARRSEVTPYLRQMADLRHEAATSERAGSVIAAMNGTTPIDGWRACLAWVLHLDPESVRKQLDTQERARYEKLSALEKRKADRELRDHLIKLRDKDNDE